LSKIRVQLIDEEGNVLEDESFTGFIGVGFNEEADDIISRSFESVSGASMLLGDLGIRDFLISKQLIDDTVKESVEELGYDYDALIEKLMGGE